MAVGWSKRLVLHVLAAPLYVAGGVLALAGLLVGLLFLMPWWHRLLPQLWRDVQFLSRRVGLRWGFTTLCLGPPALFPLLAVAAP